MNILTRSYTAQKREKKKGVSGGRKKANYENET